jgi:flavin reductase (DIM6/NTAB) family NADH-FMN oxidoreductase RutF
MIIDPGEVTYQVCYKLMIGSIVPRPIALVATVSAAGNMNLAPFSYFTAVASNPPTICFCPGRRAPGGETKDTLANIEQTGEFVVNVVTEDIATQMNESATDYPPEIDEFEVTGLTPVPSDVVAPPRVKESPINLECRLDRVIHIGKPEAGGGALVLGEIVRFHVADRLYKNGRIDIDALNPLGRLAGSGYATLGKRISMTIKKYKDA